MSLTDADKAAIRSNLGEFAKDLSGSTVLFYQILFSDYPHYKEHFAAIKDVKVEDLTNNAYMRDLQGPKTGKVLAAMVDKLDDSEGLKAEARWLVDIPQHKEFNFGKDDFHNAFKALLKALEKVLGPGKVNTAAWAKMVDIVLGML